MKKRILSILLAVLIVVGMFPVTAMAGEDYVAQVLDADGNPVGENDGKYTTLQNAVNVASSGYTIELLANLENIGTVSLPEDVTLNGNGHKIITGNSCLYINAAGGTVKNVVFQGIGNTQQTLSAIYAEYLTGKMTVESCRFLQWDWDAIQVVPKNGAEIEIKNNYFKKDTDVNSRCCVHIQGESSVKPIIKATITGNTFITNNLVASAAVWYASNNSTIDLSNNYFDVLHLNIALYDNDKLVTDKCDLAFPCKAAQEDETATVTPTYKRPYDFGVEYYRTLEEAIDADNVALIGNVVYETLADAIAAVPTNGTETTIKMIADETITGNAGVTVAAGQNIVLDLNGKTIKNAVNENKASQIINNKGTLTIKDSTDTNADGTGTGKMMNQVQSGTQAGDWWSTPQYNYTTNVIDNNGSLTILSGTLENTAAGSICYCVDNATPDLSNHPISFSLEGGLLINSDENSESAVIRNWATNNSSVTFKMTGGTVKGTYGISVTGGNAVHNFSISGGAVKAKSYALYGYSTPDLTNSIFSISGGVFGDGAISEDEKLIDIASFTGFISGGYYTENIDATYVADGYVCTNNTDDETKNAYPYIVTVAPTKVEVKEEAAKVVTTGDKKDTVDEKVTTELAGQVKGKVVNEIIENASETSTSNIQEKITEEKVQVKDNQVTKEVTLDESSKTRIDVKLESIQINVGTTTDATPTIVAECTVTTKTATYDVKPVVTVTTTDGTGATTAETFVITNDWLKRNNKVLAFTLPVPDSMTGDSVLVTHIKENNEVETFNARVEGEEGKRFITINATEFSTYELSQQTEENATAKIENGGKTYYYSSLANAISDAQSGDTITLLKDSETGTITVDRVVTFTLVLNGKTLNATIRPGDDYVRHIYGDKYYFELYEAGDTIVIGGKKDKDTKTETKEENPETGAPVLSMSTGIVLAGIALVLAKRK